MYGNNSSTTLIIIGFKNKIIIKQNIIGTRNWIVKGQVEELWGAEEHTSPGVPKLIGKPRWDPITAIRATNEMIDAANNWKKMTGHILVYYPTTKQHCMKIFLFYFNCLMFFEKSIASYNYHSTPHDWDPLEFLIPP